MERTAKDKDIKELAAIVKANREAMKGIKNASPDDYIIISDVDEIPNLEGINGRLEPSHSYSGVSIFSVFFNSQLLSISSSLQYIDSGASPTTSGNKILNVVSKDLALDQMHVRASGANSPGGEMK